MNYAGLIPLALLIVFIVGAICWIDSKLPTAEEEKAQGKRDMEDLIRRTNEANNERPRVRAGKPIY